MVGAIHQGSTMARDPVLHSTGSLAPALRTAGSRRERRGLPEVLALLGAAERAGLWPC
jgi:hypothetical protein